MMMSRKLFKIECFQHMYGKSRLKRVFNLFKKLQWSLRLCDSLWCTAVHPALVTVPLSLLVRHRRLPSRGTVVTVYVLNQPSLPTPFYSVLASISVFMTLSIVFHYANSSDNSPLSDCSSGLISALLVLWNIYLFFFFTKVPLSPDIRSGWLSSKQLTNYLTVRNHFVDLLQSRGVLSVVGWIF